MTPPPPPAPVPAPASRRSRAGRALLVSGGAAALALAVMIGWALGRDVAAPAAPTDREAQASPTAAAESPQEQLFGEVNGGFIVHEGRHQVAGRYPAGFPNSPEGAVSAAVHEIRAMATLDPADLVVASGVYYGLDVTEQQLQEEFLPQRAREIAMTMPSGGAFNPNWFPASGAFYRVEPVGVGWEELEDGTVAVAVLSEDEIGDGLGLAFTRTYIHGRQMRWDPDLRGGDWVVDLVTDPIFEDYYDFRPEDYELSNGLWTPIIAGGTSY
ncbi:hypothetical protein [Nocardiopsis sp. CC223A]|uniref:hypothetical protein n=1 Tax=Nocardiopsis sp. CC223A TaxID=3044051 RepID=UPI00278C254E|nr:hypothetical protein [Nocardiopsis sp. CC223A]